MDKYLLDLDSQEKKLISYCLEKCQISPSYVVEGDDWYVGDNFDSQLDQMISALTDVYFDVLDDNAHLADLINDAILKLNQIYNDIVENEDVFWGFSFDNEISDDFDD